jgi:hypothetical protein
MNLDLSMTIQRNSPNRHSHNMCSSVIIQSSCTYRSSVMSRFIKYSRQYRTCSLQTDSTTRRVHETRFQRSDDSIFSFCVHEFTHSEFLTTTTSHFRMNHKPLQTFNTSTNHEWSLRGSLCTQNMNVHLGVQYLHKT